MSLFSLLSAEYARMNNGLTEMKSIIRIPITITINIKHRGSQEWLWLSTDITIIQTIGTCSMATKDSNCHLHYCHHLHHHSDLKHGNQIFQLPSSSLSSPSPSSKPNGPKGCQPKISTAIITTTTINHRDQTGGYSCRWEPSSSSPPSSSPPSSPGYLRGATHTVNSHDLGPKKHQQRTQLFGRTLQQFQHIRKYSHWQCLKMTCMCSKYKVQ